MEAVKQALSEHGIVYREHLLLHTVCTLRVGGVADLGIEPANEEELQSKTDDLERREEILRNETQKLQDELTNIQTLQQDLSARQAIYNQQQLDFITRKNALSAQQFELADKVSSYNAQIKLYNDDLAKLEADKQAFLNEKALLEERVGALEQEEKSFEERKAKFEQDRAEEEKTRKELQQRAADEHAALQRKVGELQERELELTQRENSLNAAARDLRNRQLSQPYSSTEQNYNANAFGYAQPQAPATQNNTQTNTQQDLRERAHAEGIKLNMAGNLHSVAQTATYDNKPTTSNGIYNVGRTLYRAALIIFCIITFESLLIFFLKDTLALSPIYPIVGFGCGFLLFITCAIMYASGFRPRARRKKHAPYILTAAVLLVISILIVTMIAVYCKAEMDNLAQLFGYVIFPITYLTNILFFAVFFRLLSVKESKERN